MFNKVYIIRVVWEIGLFFKDGVDYWRRGRGLKMMSERSRAVHREVSIDADDIASRMVIT